MKSGDMDTVRQVLDLERPLAWRISSQLTLLATGLAVKALLALQKSVQVRGGEDFVHRLESRDRGLVTVANHVSVLDDPVVWGTLPLRVLRDPRNVRWTLGAADICFTNRATSMFFSLGQTLPTFRHGRYGPFQPSIDRSIELLSREKSWVHVFPEGFIRQEADYVMRYWKWGVSRMVLESEPTPIVVPMFIEGLDGVMHEKRVAPRFLPRLWNEITISFDPPIPDAEIQPFVSEWRGLHAAYVDKFGDKAAMQMLQVSEEAHNLRSRLAAFLRSRVEAMRQRRGYAPEDPKQSSPYYHQHKAEEPIVEKRAPT